MAVGDLIIDKASVRMNYLFKALKIVEENNGKISRIDFVRNMEIFMTGEIRTSLNQKEVSRTQFNKTKLARYYGLLRTIIDENKNQFIVLTKRGKELCKIVKEYNKDFYILDEEKLREIILYSVLYDTFGKNNDGVETSNSDLEPPKILLKAIYLCGYITSEEFIYITYSLNNLEFKTFDEAIKKVLYLREYNDSSYIKQKIKSFNKTNFVGDNKLISFFFKINIIKREGKKYYFDNDFFMKYKSIIQQLNPISKNLQLLVFGMSGSGKSHFINNIILGNIVENSQITRTTIHPDYTYSDFIGYIRPVMNNNKITYKFEPGPFTLALEQSLKYPKKNHYLFIEEMNRGNITSIFGDIFQLLDRVDDYSLVTHNRSKYSILNNDIYNYLSLYINKETLNNYLPNQRIFLPANLNIIGTINTSEQTQNLIDTAFRRRFNNLYMHLSFDNKNDENSYLSYLDILSKEKVFDNKHTWSEFAIFINQLIDEVNNNFYCIPEEKKLAPYFVNSSDLESKENFCNKVIMYLKNDVFKYNESILNDSYDKIYNEFINNNKDIFELIKEKNE